MAIIIRTDEERSFNPVTIRIEHKEDMRMLIAELKEATEYDSNLLGLSNILETLIDL